MIAICVNLLLRLLIGCTTSTDNSIGQPVTTFSTMSSGNKLQLPAKNCKGYTIRENKVYLYDEIIKGADPKTFECIKYEYARDKDRVYFSTEAFPKAHAASFEVLDHGFAKDKNYVFYNYYSKKIIKDADALTFKIVDPAIVKDKNFVYILDRLETIRKLNQADAKTFRKFGLYYIDKNFIYNVSGEVLDKVRKYTTEELTALCMAEGEIM